MSDARTDRVRLLADLRHGLAPTSKTVRSVAARLEPIVVTEAPERFGTANESIVVNDAAVASEPHNPLKIAMSFRRASFTKLLWFQVYR